MLLYSMSIFLLAWNVRPVSLSIWKWVNVFSIDFVRSQCETGKWIFTVQDWSADDNGDNTSFLEQACFQSSFCQHPDQFCCLFQTLLYLRRKIASLRRTSWKSRKRSFWRIINVKSRIFMSFKIILLSRVCHPFFRDGSDIKDGKLFCICR